MDETAWVIGIIVLGTGALTGIILKLLGKHEQTKQGMKDAGAGFAAAVISHFLRKK